MKKINKKAMGEEQLAGKGCEILVPFNERRTVAEIEHSLRKEYRKEIWQDFVKAVKEYHLVEEGDRIAVAVSGGKDSLLMAKLFQEMKRHRQVAFEAEFISMDPGYYGSIRDLLLENCAYLEIPLHLFNSDIFRIVDRIAQDYPCYMCAKMRRGALYSKAQELGCNKLALGHHFNDVVETILLNLFYAGSFKTMLPRLKSKNYPGIELIRPMYYVREEYIEDWIRTSGIWPLNCACMVAAQKLSTKRDEVKEIIKNLKEICNDIDKSILKASQNVDLGAIVGWRREGKQYSYLDFYDDPGEEE